VAKKTRALQVLEQAKVPFTAHAYELTETAETYGEAVAAQLGVDPRRLYKTLLASVDGAPVVAIVPVADRLALKGLARAAGGKKAEMIDPATAERLTGYVTGGISPFGQKRRLAVFVDASIGDHDTIYCSAGRRGLQVEVDPTDLTRLLDATIVPLIQE
jgi:Cys-tRNA(Pro)/Cys-tRNA(Cys) deacylase